MIRSSPTNGFRSWLFLVVLTVPAVAMMVELAIGFRAEDADSLARAPKIEDVLQQPLTYADSWDQYLQDHFGLRQFLLDSNSRIRGLFKAPAAYQVVVGKDGWLFFNGGLLTASRMPPPRNPALARQVTLLNAVSRRLASRGIPLVVLFVPDKHSIYPEQLPDWLAGRHSDDKLTFLAARLRQQGIAVVDIRQTLDSLKSSSPVFFRTDTHWTAIGAISAFNAITRRSQGILRPIRVPSRASLVPGPPRDLARMARLEPQPSDWVIQDDVPNAAGRVQESLAVANTNPQRPFVLRRPGSDPKVLIIGDSFSKQWPDYALQSASVAYWSHHNQCMADWQKLLDLDVDLVVYEMVERSVGCPPLSPQLLEGIAGKQN